MALLPSEFDAAQVKPSTGGADVWPLGKNVAQIVSNEMCATKDGSGQYLKLQLESMDGAGLRIFDILNLVNNNDTAVQIARGTLSAICHAIGQLRVTDADQLMFKPLVIDIKAGDKYTDKEGVQRDGNQRIRSYAPYDPQHPPVAAPAKAATVPMSAARPGASATPPATRSGAAPWGPRT